MCPSWHKTVRCVLRRVRAGSLDQLIISLGTFNGSFVHVTIITFPVITPALPFFFGENLFIKAGQFSVTRSEMI